MGAAGRGVPLYQRIQGEIRERVQRGELVPGDQLETELELMARHDVSRATVRQALAGLIGDGLLEIRRGLGTYVRPAAMEHRLGGFYSFSREIERHGRVARTRVRSLRLEPADERVAAALAIEPATPVVALGRIRLADDDPIVVETSYLPAALFPGLELVDFTTRRLYDTLTLTYGVRPVRARETFEPVLLTAAEADLLDARHHQPALRVHRIAYDSADTPIEFCRSTLRADRYRYVVELRES